MDSSTFLFYEEVWNTDPKTRTSFLVSAPLRKMRQFSTSTYRLFLTASAFERRTDATSSIPMTAS
jgi:hypothetical protein